MEGCNVGFRDACDILFGWLWMEEIPPRNAAICLGMPRSLSAESRGLEASFFRGIRCREAMSKTIAQENEEDQKSYEKLQCSWD